MAYTKPPEVLAEQAARRDRLIHATLQTLARHGMPDGSWSLIDKVATRAKLSTGLIYKYFPNARELIEQTIALVTQRDLARVRDAAGIGGVTSNATALAYALMVIYGLHPHPRLRSLLLAHPLWREAMTAVLSTRLTTYGLSAKQVTIVSAAALGAVIAAADVGERSKNNALAVTLFVLRGVGVSLPKATAVMAMASKLRYSIEEDAS